MGRSTCLIESPSLDERECKVMSKQIRFSAFFGQEHKEETAEMSTVNVEAEPENDQSSESKSKLPKRNFQQSWLGKSKSLKFDPLIQRVCSVGFAKNQRNKILLPLVVPTTGLQQ